MDIAHIMTMKNVKQLSALFFLLGVTIFVSLSKAYADGPIESSGLSKNTISRMLQIQDDVLAEPINCWGVALWSIGFIDELRPALKSEVLYNLKRNKCRKLGPKEAAIAGDIGSFYNSEQGIYHSFIYLNSQWAFEKGSPYKKELPIAVDLKSKFDVIKDYSTGCKYKEGDYCFWGIVNYRCDLPVPSINVTNPNISQFEVLLKSMQSCDGSSFCKEKLNIDFLAYTSLLESMIFESQVSSPSAFTAFINLLLLIQGSKDFLSYLTLDSSNAFVSIEKKIEALESNTPKAPEDFPSFQ
jgi:hypothetical protein